MNNSPGRMRKPAPICVGTGLVALDYIINKSVERPPLEWAGGSCGNVLTILSFLGWGSIPVARLGNDLARKRIIADVEKFGVDTKYLIGDPTIESPIIFEFIREGKHGAPTHRFDIKCPYCGSMLPRFRPITLEMGRSAAASVVRATAFYFDRVSPAAVLLASHFRKQGALVFFEPTSTGEPNILERALAVSHIVKFSAQQVSNWEPIARSRGPQLIIATHGAKGADYCMRMASGRFSTWRHVGGYVVENLVDAAGAGDWCSAGFINSAAPEWNEHGKFLSEQSVVDALRYGQALSALNCRFEGARGAMYTFDPTNFNAAVKAVLASVDPPFGHIPKSTKSHRVNACPHCRKRALTSRTRRDREE